MSHTHVGLNNFQDYLEAPALHEVFTTIVNPLNLELLNQARNTYYSKFPITMCGTSSQRIMKY